MERIKDRLMRFMVGRYGVDQLYYVLLVTCLTLMVVNAFLRSPAVDILMWAVLIWMIFRTYSRNVYKRSAENVRFLRIRDGIRSKGSLTMRRIRERKTHIYRNCPQCKATLRLPRERGGHTVDCPRCHHEFIVKIHW